MIDAINLCSGAGGWEQGLRILGHAGRVAGIEWDAMACATAREADHDVVRADVSVLDPADYPSRGLIGSPPCTTFSSAGRRTGVSVLAVLADGIVRTFAGEDCRAEIVAKILPVALAQQQAANARRRPDRRSTDEQLLATAQRDAETTVLVLEPARWLADGSREWVALEQVPEVLPLWQVYARELTARDWSAWAGVLNSADYGVPQTRERAILIASRTRRVHAPWPTHCEGGAPEDMLGESRLPWVSMAEALGWLGDWTVQTRGDRRGGGGARSAAGARGAGVRNHVPPAPPAMDNGNFRFVSAGVTGEDRAKDPATSPADTLSGKGTAYWVRGLRNNTQGNGCERSPDEPAGTLFFGGRLNNVSWVLERPATTVQGDPRVGRPGHKDRAGGEAQFAQDSVRITVDEAAVLQSFPADYPWQGTSTARHRQVGNAIPPMLAAAVLSVPLGLPWPPAPLEVPQPPLVVGEDGLDVVAGRPVG